MAVSEFDLEIPDGFIEVDDLDDLSQLVKAPSSETTTIQSKPLETGGVFQRIHSCLYKSKYKWAVTNFNEWVKSRNVSEFEEDHIHVHPDVLYSASAAELNIESFRYNCD